MAASTEVLDYVTGVGSTVSAAATPHDAETAFEDRTVHFKSTESARLPEADPERTLRARALIRWREVGRPVFLELDEQRVIRSLQVPFVGLVARLKPFSDGAVAVGLSTSAVRFRLLPANPGFSRIRSVLDVAWERGTPVTLIATSRYVILDVRDGDSLQWFRADPPFIKAPVQGDKAIAAASSVTRTKAKDLFDELMLETCDVQAAAKGCIPFLFPDDGCWARADRVCDLLRSLHGLTAAKVWIHGDDLAVRTENSPFCTVTPDWHVAPALRIGFGSAARLTIFDPVVSEVRPVSLVTWTRAFGDPAAEVSITEPAVYRQVVVGQFAREPQGQGAFDLDNYRALLAQRVDEDGPPPYQCSP